MSTFSPPTLFSPSLHPHIIPSLASLHASTITHSHALSIFLPPLNTSAIQSWWTDRIVEIHQNKRLLILSTDPSDKNEVVGAALLTTPITQTGSFRSVVEGVWVRPSLQRKGLGRRLVGKLEEEAREIGRGQICVDVEAESGVEEFWRKVGFQKMGVISDGAVSPKDGRDRDVALMHKDLRKPGTKIATEM